MSWRTSVSFRKQEIDRHHLGSAFLAFLTETNCSTLQQRFTFFSSIEMPNFLPGYVLGSVWLWSFFWWVQRRNSKTISLFGLFYGLLYEKPSTEIYAIFINEAVTISSWLCIRVSSVVEFWVRPKKILCKGPFKYYVSKEVGRWVWKMSIFA